MRSNAAKTPLSPPSCSSSCARWCAAPTKTRRCGRASTIRRGCCSARSSRFSSTAIFRYGRARSAARRWLPVWQWLIRDGAPEAAREFEAALASARESATTADLEPSVRKFQLAAANAIVKVATPVPGDDKQRALARVGAPNVIEDLLPIGAVLQAREALETLSSRLPSYLRVFGESQMPSTTASLNVPSLQTPQLLPFALSLIMQRLTAPWQIIRLAIKMAASDDEIRVAATPYGVAVTIALHDLSFLRPACAPISGAGSSTTSPNSSSRSMMACAACAPNSTCATILPGASNWRRSGPTSPTRCSRKSTA